jgi:hypothetical protein
MNCSIWILALLISHGQSETPRYDSTTAYDKRSIAGFTVYVNKTALSHAEQTDPAMVLLETKLKEIDKLVPPEQLKVMHQTTIWVEWDKRPRGAAEYHTNATWLRENGYNPAKLKCVEINNVSNFVKWTGEDQPMMILHELSHAYHDKALSMNNAEVRSAYDNAVKSHAYDSVERIHGKKQKAYALTDSAEYFAELSEAWFGRNDFYPFTRDELKTHDPMGYALMEKVWAAKPNPKSEAGHER